MTISASASKEDDYANELYPDIAAVASVYGDAGGKYAAFLTRAEPQFAQEGFYLWDQPFAEEEGLVPGHSSPSPSPGATSDSTAKSATKDNGASRTVECYGLITFILGFCLYINLI